MKAERQMAISIETNNVLVGDPLLKKKRYVVKFEVYHSNFTVSTRTEVSSL